MWLRLSVVLYVCTQNLSSLGSSHPQGNKLFAFPLGQSMLSHHGVVVFLWYSHITWTALVMTVLVPVFWQAYRHLESWHSCVASTLGISSWVCIHSIFSKAKYCWLMASFCCMLYRHDPIQSSFSHQSLFVSMNGSTFNQHHSVFPVHFVRFVSLMLYNISTASLVRFIASVFVCICCVVCVLFCIITKMPASPIAKMLILINISMMVNHDKRVPCFWLVIGIQKIISK